MINTLLKRRMENTKKNKKGFTLVELIVVLVIIAILAAVLVPTVTGYIGKAKKSAAVSELKNICTAVQAAATDSLDAEGSIKADSASFVTNCGTYGVTKAKANCTALVVVDSGTGAIVKASYKDGSYGASYDGSSYSSGKQSTITDVTATAGQVLVTVSTNITLTAGA